MFPHDAAKVVKIRLPSYAEDDLLAWHYDRSGLFMVRSAYKLALEADQDDRLRTGSSSRPDGSRTLYNEIWLAKVPPKVKVFAWRLS
jgi:hypothetical protein